MNGGAEPDRGADISLRGYIQSHDPLFESNSDDGVDGPASLWTTHRRAWVSTLGHSLALLVLSADEASVGSLVTELSALDFPLLHSEGSSITSWSPELPEDLYPCKILQTHFSDCDSVLGVLTTPLDGGPGLELHLLDY